MRRHLLITLTAVTLALTGVAVVKPQWAKAARPARASDQGHHDRRCHDPHPGTQL